MLPTMTVLPIALASSTAACVEKMLPMPVNGDSRLNLGAKALAVNTQPPSSTGASTATATTNSASGANASRTLPRFAPRWFSNNWLSKASA